MEYVYAKFILLKVMKLKMRNVKQNKARFFPH